MVAEGSPLPQLPLPARARERGARRVLRLASPAHGFIGGQFTQCGETVLWSKAHNFHCHPERASATEGSHAPVEGSMRSLTAGCGRDGLSTAVRDDREW